MGRQKARKPPKTRGMCQECRQYARRCIKCGKHVFWVRLLSGGDAPVGAHDGTVCCG